MNTKNDHRHLIKRQKRSRNDVKSARFWHVLRHISAIFESMDLKFCTDINQPFPSKTLDVFFF